MLRLTVEVPIEEGELIVRALDCAVAGGEVTTDVDPDAVAESKGTAWRAQQADALVAVAKSYLDGGGGAKAARRRIITRSSFTRTRNPSREGRDVRICRSTTVKRLLCDCSMVLVAEDADGNPLDVGRKQRTVSTPLKRALYARDRGCTFPGCHRKRYLDGHHLTHWINGGETSADNMTLLCTYHHRLLHEGGFSIVSEEATTRCDSSRPTAERSRGTAIGSRTSSMTVSATRPTRIPPVRDSAPRQCSTIGNAAKCAKPPRSIGAAGRGLLIAARAHAARQARASRKLTAAATAARQLSFWGSG